MKNPALLVFLASVAPLHAVNLMLDFGSPPANSVVAAPYLTLSPGHSTGAIPGSQTNWNTITTSDNRSDLVYANGAAAGVTLDLGQETPGATGIIDFGTAVGAVNLAGGGGGIQGQQGLLGTGSIYGDNTSSTAVGRDGFFGAGTASTMGAIGLRLDGLAAGDYVAYVMARNTNSNAASYPMNLYSSVGTTSTSFTMSSVTASQANPGYTTGAYAGQFTSFILGDNYQTISFTVAEGQSFFLAVDGGNDAVDRRGFLNALQIVSVPEPSSSALLLGGLGFLFTRRQRRAR
ncbi:PEP-CTERM sorting domain-containing protein [Luteolibacter sp. Populi]|uniref:PEP-CTERM sorting domain-containing protein n=1 Tax=Luteolibacter sp. Populi TaxID=3230487 RepID=UPI003465C52E